MFKKSRVLFKGKGSGLIIVLDKNASYEDLKAELIDKVTKSKTFFKGASEDIKFEGKELTSEQENEIATIIINNAGLDIGFINLEPDDNFASRKTFGANQFLFEEEKDEPPASLFGNNDAEFPRFENAEEKVLIYNGFVRSGTLVESDGNIIIIGGVNPGGEVFAGRNIVVFGQLKGKAVAGRSEGTDCFIAAVLMEPELLGIANYITRFPDAKKDKLYKSPSLARLESNKIIISPVGNLGVVK